MRLSRLTGSLCDAVTGRNDSSALLAQLEQANLFLVPLDGAGQMKPYAEVAAAILVFLATPTARAVLDHNRGDHNRG